MEIDEILDDSDSALETQIGDLDLSWTDEEDEDNYISATNAQKRHAARKWCPSGFDPTELEFSDIASGINRESKIGGNKPSDYFRAFLTAN